MSTQVPVPFARNEVRQVIPRLIELTETLLYPGVMSAARVVKQVFEEKKP